MDATEENKRPGTRVFKKTSPNGKLTCYLAKRDFVDHGTHVDPIDGVVLVDKQYLENNKVYGHVLAAFRYGREDLDVLGITFRKDLYLASEEIYPREKGAKELTLTKLQERLIRKLGPDAYPFLFELPPHSPASVTLQPASTDSGGKNCGVDYELCVMLKNVSTHEREEKAHKRNQVRLAIRKITYAPQRPLGTQPSIEVFKEFVMSPNKLHLEASLDKELYYHNEVIAVNVHVANNSNRHVKKIRVSVRQFAEICLFSTASYKCTVAEIESDEGCPVQPGFTLSKIYYLKPTLDDNNNKEKRGLALDGELKHACTHLASSTLITDTTQKESLGIIVTYRVKVKLCLGPLGGDLAAELPFILMHPKPVEDTPSLPAPNPSVPSVENEKNPGIDTDLIRLDTDDGDDDLIFEDFARLRLRGETDA